MVEKKVYVSEDGCNFDTESACIAHEVRMKAESEFDGNIVCFLSPVFSAWGSDEEYRGAFVAHFSSQSDVESCKSYLKTHYYVCDYGVHFDFSPSDFPCYRVVEWEGEYAITESLNDVFSKASKLSAKLADAIQTFVL